MMTTATILPQAASGAWYASHVALGVAGAACFAAAAAAGAAYLGVHGRLRRRDPSLLVSHLPSLEKLDRFARRALVAGFALLTGAIISGVCDAFWHYDGNFFAVWQAHPKILVASAAWLVGAVALRTALARRSRGRRMAVLCIAGFVLVTIAIVVSLLVPDG